MDDKEKNAEVAKAIKLPDLASYMQVVIKQLEIDKKWSAVHLSLIHISEPTRHAQSRMPSSA